MNDEQPSGNPWLKSLLMWGGVFIVLLLAISMLGARGETPSTAIGYSDFRAQVAQGTVASAQVGEAKITGKFKDGKSFTTVPLPNDPTLAELLQKSNVRYEGKPAEEPNLVLYMLVQALPFVLILGVAFYFLP